MLKLKCTKFDFSWDSVPDPTEGVYFPLAGFQGPTSTGKGGDTSEVNQEAGRGSCTLAHSLKCFIMSAFRRNFASQRKHENFQSAEAWTGRCFRSSGAVWKLFEHSAQTNGLADSWRRTCTRRLSRRLNLSWQTGHENHVPSP